MVAVNNVLVCSQRAKIDTHENGTFIKHATNTKGRPINWLLNDMMKTFDLIAENK